MKDAAPWVCMLIGNLWLMLAVSTQWQTTALISFGNAGAYFILALGLAGVLP